MTLPPAGWLASWMYDHPTSYVMAVGLIVAAVLVAVALFAWTVITVG